MLWLHAREARAFPGIRVAVTRASRLRRRALELYSANAVDRLEEPTVLDDAAGQSSAAVEEARSHQKGAVRSRDVDGEFVVRDSAGTEVRAGLRFEVRIERRVPDPVDVEELNESAHLVGILEQRDPQRVVPALVQSRRGEQLLVDRRAVGHISASSGHEREDRTRKAKCDGASGPRCVGGRGDRAASLQEYVLGGIRDGSVLPPR